MSAEPSVAASREFWFDETTDLAMEGEHGFVWRAMVDMVDVDLAGARVLDIGCSTGGFLRLLADSAGIAEGFGYDPAARPVEIAEERRGDRRLTFAASDRCPDGWGDFEVAFSHEVLFTLHDLEDHARDIRDGLRPGGVYYAVMGVHDRNHLIAEWHRDVADQLSLPRLYSLDEVADAFTKAGFEAHIGHLRIPFIPVAAAEGESLETTLDYYDRLKMMFRFVRS